MWDKLEKMLCNTKKFSEHCSKFSMEKIYVFTNKKSVSLIFMQNKFNRDIQAITTTSISFASISVSRSLFSCNTVKFYIKLIVKIKNWVVSWLWIIIWVVLDMNYVFDRIMVVLIGPLTLFKYNFISRWGGRLKNHNKLQSVWLFNFYFIETFLITFKI
mgnify:FL=1